MRRAMLEFAMKFQQVTAPVTAKGVEDTAFYRYNRLVCLNEVGGDPGRFGILVGGLAPGQLWSAQGRGRIRCWRLRRTIPSAAKMCARASPC